MNSGTRQQIISSQARSRSSVIRPVSQVLLRIGARSTGSSFDRTRDTIVNFIDRRAGLKLPDEAWRGESFELEEIGAQRAAAVALDSPRYWAARLDDADKTVPQRSWIIEIGLGETNSGAAILGTRLLCVTRGDDVGFDRTIPGFIRTLAETGNVELDGRAVAGTPWIVDIEEDVDDLVELLTDPKRRSDVIVFSLPEGSTDPRQTTANPYTVAARTIGAAHVVILTGPASYHLSDRVGKEFSVFLKAIRTYKPLFDPISDEPFKHPLGLPHRVENWSPDGPSGYERLLISHALIRTVSGGDIEDRVPSFSSVRRKAAEGRLARAQSAGSSDADLLKLAEDEIQALRQSLDEEKETSSGLLKTADEERNKAQSEAAQAYAVNSHLRHRIQQLEEQLKSVGAQAHEALVPDTMEGFEQWCQQSLLGSVEVLNRAYQGVKKSEFEDVSLIYKALALLRDYYVPMKRLGGAAWVEKYENACKALGISEEPTFSGDRAGEEGDTYFVKYAGRRVELDRHLKKGNSREPRYCFRLYFFWDDENEQVVVGWLPSHLSTRAS